MGWALGLPVEIVDQPPRGLACLLEASLIEASFFVFEASLLGACLLEASSSPRPVASRLASSRPASVFRFGGSSAGPATYGGFNNDFPRQAPNQGGQEFQFPRATSCM